MSKDTIYRKDAIKATWQEPTYTDPLNVLTEVRDRIEVIPSADNDVIGKLKTAIENEEICKNCPTAERITGKNLLGAMALGFSYGVEAERPQGEWIYHMDEAGNVKTVSCAVCGGWVDVTIPEQTAKFAYCPYCGVRMFAKGINVPNKEGADDEP